MIRKNPWGQMPNISPSAFIDPSAIVIGNVKIGKNVFVGPGAVIRADEPGSAVVICDDCNVQDRVIVHALSGTKVRVGKRTSLSHGCIVHGPCLIGNDCFIGFGSVVFSSKVGDGVMVKSLTAVEDARIPPGSVVKTGTSIRKMSAAEKSFCRKVVRTNLKLAGAYKVGDFV